LADTSKHVSITFPKLITFILQEKKKEKLKTYDSIMDGDGELVIDAVKAFTLVLSRQAETEGFES
jgi:hypothetical protein